MSVLEPTLRLGVSLFGKSSADSRRGRRSGGGMAANSAPDGSAAQVEWDGLLRAAATSGGGGVLGGLCAWLREVGMTVGLTPASRAAERAGDLTAASASDGAEAAALFAALRVTGAALEAAPFAAAATCAVDAPAALFAASDADADGLLTTAEVLWRPVLPRKECNTTT